MWGRAFSLPPGFRPASTAFTTLDHAGWKAGGGLKARPHMS
jgi:hypothetical protein